MSQHRFQPNDTMIQGLSGLPEPRGATFYPNSGGVCSRCGLDDKSHEFRCAMCDRVLARGGKCGCGRGHLLPAETCHGAVYFYCSRTN